MPDISLWNICNNKCVMCTNPKEYSNADPQGNYDIKTQIKKLKLYIKGMNVYNSNSDKKDYINITGGEPTLHPDFLRFITYLRKELPEIPITLLTNGRSFSNENFLAKFVSLATPPFTVAVSFHSYNKKTFEKITGIKNSYEQTIKGIKNIALKFKGELEIRIVIHRLNIKDLDKTILFLKDFLLGYKNWRITIIHYEIEGISEKNKRKIYLKLSESAQKIYSIKDILNGINLRLYHFPLCVLNKELRKYAWITLAKDERIYTDKCKNCKLKKKCLGLMKRYYELYGDSELKTILE